MQTEQTAATRRSGLYRLALSSALVSLAWLVVLPWIANRPAIRAHIDFLDRERIDPSAMYYTELEAMEPILERLNRRDRRLPPAGAPMVSWDQP